MRIRLDQVKDEPFIWQETCEVPLEALDRPELVRLSPVVWRGQVTFADPGFYLKARLSYEQTLACNRCLKPTTQAIATDVDLLIVVEGPRPVTGEHELHERDLGVLYVTNEEMDTGPLLHEQLQLNIPMKPLCRPDCAGLCPVCGADLNLGPCGCREKPADPRWAALASLRERMDDK